jgi:DNA-3-methyladenine glycosylase
MGRDNFLVYKLPSRVLLPQSFFARDTVTVARALLGKRLRAGPHSGLITEVEAYLGRDDLAAHASRGITKRTRVIYGPPGHAYVYLIYGIHHCLNLIAEPDGTPGCVLIRSLDTVSGPGRLTHFLDLTVAYNAQPVFSPQGFLRVEESGLVPETIEITARIGITHCKDWPLRFLAPRLLPSKFHAPPDHLP